MNDFTKFLVKSFVRKGLTLLGGILLTRGILTQSEADSLLSAYLEEIVGALLIAISAAWGFLYQRYVRAKVTTALEMEPGTSTEALERAVAERMT